MQHTAGTHAYVMNDHGEQHEQFVSNACGKIAAPSGLAVLLALRCKHVLPVLALLLS